MKKRLLPFSILLTIMLLFTTVPDEALEAQAKRIDVTNAEIKAIKKGKFLYSKASVGASEATLKKKKLKRSYSNGSLSYSHTTKGIRYMYDFTVYVPQKKGYAEPKTFKKTKILSAYYKKNGIRLTNLNKHFKKEKKYTFNPYGPEYTITTYIVGKKRLVVHGTKDYATMELFATRQDMINWITNAN